MARRYQFCVRGHQLKLDGITVTDLLGADTDIRPADSGELPVSAPTPSLEMQAEEELLEEQIEELQAEQLEEISEELHSKPPLSEVSQREDRLSDELPIAQSAEAMGESETEAQTEDETEAFAEKSGFDEDDPTS